MRREVRIAVKSGHVHRHRDDGERHLEAPFRLHRRKHASERDRESAHGAQSVAQHNSVRLCGEGDEHLGHEHIEPSLGLPLVLARQKGGTAMHHSRVPRETPFDNGLGREAQGKVGPTEGREE
eukprot:3920848-Prymnesium_polylepis.2